MNPYYWVVLLFRWLEKVDAEPSLNIPKLESLQAKQKEKSVDYT